jgi:hypothetical protein
MKREGEGMKQNKRMPNSKPKKKKGEGVMQDPRVNSTEWKEMVVYEVDGL